MKQFLNARFGIQLAAGGTTYLALRLISSLFLPGVLSMLLSLIAYALVFDAAGPMYDQHEAAKDRSDGS